MNFKLQYGLCKSYSLL